MESDQTTTIAQVKSAIEEFAEERNWKQFHDPKNLAMALASEAGELLQHFRWLRSDEAFAALSDKQQAEEVANELADVVMFAFEFATVCGIDITQAVDRKLKINERRHPVEKKKHAQ